MQATAIRKLRVVLYCILFAFAAVTMALCAVRLHYTTHLPAHTETNYGHSFYDRIVVELLVTSVLTVLWTPPAAYMIHKKRGHRFSFVMELVWLFVLFVLWLVGAAIATHTSNPPYSNIYWGDLSSCWASFWQCRTLTAMLAFTWLSCIVVLALFITSLVFAVTHKAYRDPMHGQRNHLKAPFFPKLAGPR